MSEPQYLSRYIVCGNCDTNKATITVVAPAKGTIYLCDQCAVKSIGSIMEFLDAANL